MSCWVAPAVAAEMWHCGIEQVLEAVRSGSIPSRIEGGFLLVEVAFGSISEPVKTKRRFIEEADPILAPPPISAPPPPRAGEEIVTAQEMAALEERHPRHRPQIDWDTSSDDPEDEEALAAVSGESSKYDMSQWRQVRTATSRLRRPPR